MPPLQSHRSANIPHLAEAWRYGIYSMGCLLLLYIQKTMLDFITFTQKQQCGRITATVHSKNINLLSLLFSEKIIL
jgi:hypothetical protein